MRYLKIKKNLYLLEQTVSHATAKPRPSNINHIWIYDRSGSMSGVLSELARDLIVKAKEIPVGDTLTLGWFSSEGEYNFMLKGYKVTEARDYKVIEDTINKNKSTIGMTCFSEILADTDTVIKDLSAISKNFSMCFFTDGYPTTYPYDKEIRAIHAAIEKIGSKIASSLLVGYGNYYNKELMTKMAQGLGGSLIHSESLPSFSRQLEGFMKDSRGNGSKVKVTLDYQPHDGLHLVFGINGSQINTYEPYLENRRASVDFVPTQAAQDSVYYLSETEPSGEQVTLSDNELQRPTNRESMIKGVYGAAYLLTQQTKSDVALEVLATIGDKDMIDSVNNAFTNTEYGRAEAKMQEAVANPKRRFMQGINRGYLPAADAFCLLDALKILMQDEEAMFYPFHPDFEYERIGAGSKTKDGYPKFEHAKEVKCALNKLNWNKTMLNLSVLAQIPGSVELTGDFKKHGFSNPYPTYVWRNYALVKDGFLNVQKLPVSASYETIMELYDAGVVDKMDPGLVAFDKMDHNNIITLHLDRIPVINRSIAEGKTSAAKLCAKAFKEIQLQGALKALKYLQEELDPDGKSKLGKGALSPDQELYLASQGVGKNGFSPPVEKLPTTDFYMAKEFDIQMKGLSSLPSVKDVLKKTAEGKKLTPSMELVKSGLDLFDSGLKKSASEKMKLAFLDDEISKLKKELVSVRSDIQETKFAIILGKKWFDEFSSREKSNLTLAGVEYTLNVSETKVEL